jgi:hypothetical protein
VALYRLLYRCNKHNFSVSGQQESIVVWSVRIKSSTFLFKLIRVLIRLNRDRRLDLAFACDAVTAAGAKPDGFGNIDMIVALKMVGTSVPDIADLTWDACIKMKGSRRRDKEG